MARQSHSYLKFGCLKFGMHDYTPQCEFKIVLPALWKPSSGVFIFSVSQIQTPSLEAL